MNHSHPRLPPHPRGPPMSRHLILLLCILASATGRADTLRDAIDAELKAAWGREKVTPVGQSSDGEFLRRATIDLVGTIPTYAELSAFLADTGADRRKKAIARLLADPRFAKHQAQVWDQVWFGRDAPEPARKRDEFRAWLSAKLAKGEGFDRIAAAVLRAEEPGSEMFLVQFRGRPEDATEAVSRTFLGTQLQCARCHDHPFDPTLTQRDFYGMAGFLVRLVVLDQGKGAFKVGEKSTGEVLFSGSAKDARPGRKGDPVKPKFLGGAALDEPPPPKDFKEKDTRTAKDLPKPLFSRKDRLAEWATSPDNPYFTRAVVNRVWGQLMGRGIVHPVDDLGGKNVPSLPGLLDRLTKDFKAKKFDLRWLIGEIVSSEAYQLTHKGGPPDALPKWHERARVRPLSAEEMLAAMCTANAFEESGGKFSGAIREYVRMYFGKPTNGLGEFQAGLAEHLFLNNSGEVRQIISRRKGNLADTLLTSTDPWEKRIDRLFLSVLSRLPTDKERARFVEHIKSEPKPDGPLEEAIWVLMNSSEFRFQH